MPLIPPVCVTTVSYILYSRDYFLLCMNSILFLLVFKPLLTKLGLNLKCKVDYGILSKAVLPVYVCPVVSVRSAVLYQERKKTNPNRVFVLRQCKPL